MFIHSAEKFPLIFFLLLNMQMVMLSIACLMVLIICNPLPTQGAHVAVIDEVVEVNAPGPSQLNVDDFYGQHRAKIVRRSPEPLPCRQPYILCGRR